MRRVSTGVNFGDLGVKVLTTRSTKAGGILLEIEGDDKAVMLEGKIKEIVGKPARVRRPEWRTPALILDISDWIKADEVACGTSGL